MTFAADQFVQSTPHPTAIFLPAVNSTYAAIGSLWIPPKRPLPAGFELSDLAFWSGNSKLWNHKFLLHSIGNYSAGADTRGELFARAPGLFTFIGDSGGFQIGKGRFAGFKGLQKDMAAADAVATWRGLNDEKRWIIHWLDQYSDYAMTIDMPLWATLRHGVDSPFHKCSEEQLLAMTNDNLRLIEREMVGRTKWINVVQATTIEDGIRWYDGVKWFKHGGWSLAGNAGWRGGLFNMLLIILMMRDDDAFSAGQDWLHVLGLSQPKWNVFLTGIQQGLRLDNPNLQVSCDSATAFDMGGRFEKYAVPPVLGQDERDWTVRCEQLEQLSIYSDPSNPFPFPAKSPLGSLMQMHHVVVNRDPIEGRRLDTLSNMLLINHSLWVYLDAERRVNAAAFNSKMRDIPDSIATALDIIQQAFTLEGWVDFLNRQSGALDRIAPLKQ